VALRESGGPSVGEGGAATIATEHVTKRYGRLAANRDVSVSIVPGRVHGLVGENGAGKSTLAKILAGATRPTSGTVLIGGEPVEFGSTRDAIARGVGMVPQHPSLIPEMTVVDNCLFGHRSGSSWFVSRGSARAELEAIGEPLGFDVDLDVPVAKLSLGERQRAEIMRLLRRRATTLILDEPTDVLSPRETKQLFASLRVIVEAGATVVIITHRLSEIFDIADDVTVLRDGAVAGTGAIADLTEPELVRWMLGREYSAPVRQPGEARASGAPVVLEAVGLSTDGRIPVRDVSLSVHAGEIVGIAGVDGNGQEDLAGAIAGTVRTTGGRVELGGRDVGRLSPSRRNAAGLGYIPSDRHHEGLVLSMTVAENIGLRGFQRDGAHPHGRIVRMSVLRERAADLIQRHGIKAESPDTPVSALSGGNQQKVILAREISERPKLLVASQPTRGLDIAAVDAVHTELLALARDGSGVLLISSDLDELLRLCDRLVVIARGRLVEHFDGPDYDVEVIGRAMTASGAVDTIAGAT
jgi:simple sugar transport system ATP-binding protein